VRLKQAESRSGKKTMTTLSDILETTALDRVATGFVFTEGPLWHPDGFFYFVDIRSNLLYRMVLGKTPEKIRETLGGNGTTFDLQGRLIICEGDGRRVSRFEADGTATILADRFEGKRLNRPNDVICHSNGSLLFTDPGFRVPVAERDLDAAVYRIAPDGGVSMVVPVEYPNGLALSKDERTLYVANTRWTQYIHAVELDSAGNLVRRRIFADMSADGTNGVPDGMKLDAAGRVFCTGTGGVWVFEPDGTRVGIIEMPEVCANVSFGGPDLRTLLLTASTSVYTHRVKVPGLPHPWYGVRRS
jgi:gluconolactonase